MKSKFGAHLIVISHQNATWHVGQLWGLCSAHLKHRNFAIHSATSEVFIVEVFFEKVQAFQRLHDLALPGVRARGVFQTTRDSVNHGTCRFFFPDCASGNLGKQLLYLMAR